LKRAFLVRFDGAIWKELNPGTQGTILGISGTTTGGDVFIAGTSGSLPTEGTGAILRATRQ